MDRFHTVSQLLCVILASPAQCYSPSMSQVLKFGPLVSSGGLNLIVIFARYTPPSARKYVIALQQL